jgi:hypothetical protein
MKKLRDLLGRGYFPRELPPVFDTATMRRVATHGRAAPPSFWSTVRTSHTCQHSVPRSGTLRRPLAIPNPVGYTNLCKEIDASWRPISTHLGKSSISKSIPHFYTAGARAGLPEVPDASLIISEIVLAAIDESFQTSGRIRGLRYVDDYELVFSSSSEAEDALARLEQTLAEYGLDPNPKKTRIQQLPIPHEFPWVTEIRSLPLRNSQLSQARDVLRVFDTAFEYARLSPDEHVLRYMVGRLKNVKWDPSNWPFFQHLLLQAVVAEPATLATALGYLMQGRDEGFDLEEDLVAEVLNRLITQHATLGHGSEASGASGVCCRLIFQLRQIL